MPVAAVHGVGVLGAVCSWHHFGHLVTQGYTAPGMPAAVLLLYGLQVHHPGQELTLRCAMPGGCSQRARWASI